MSTNIFISFGNKTKYLTLMKKMTINNLKLIINDMEAYPIKNILLICNGKILESGTIESNKIQNDDMVIIMINNCSDNKFNVIYL